jgi:hypothetical protein
VNSTTFLDDDTGYLKHYAPYYFIGPLLGAAIAGFFHIIHKPVLVDEDAEEDELISQSEKGL